ncbi:efflux transporter outer membrane subunit [Actomonas aquatica]|uniref:Efflux transporter outer membrane subunit n=1 Tax=Actomonas aquatica TaxID=2866162 RepID=A0ABZ1C6C6_9BACT|nr:efflux transporter outer membrane subunit [Opitutus sp. WL0086]WRQ87282.1 efflux transporter outer membrane subunit [Opitutus sp. WL0086]
MTKRLFLPLATSLGLLAGCSLAPKYERPVADIAATYPGVATAVETQTDPAAAWGNRTEFFGDARINAIIDLALEHNTDLQVATLNVERVRALYNIQRTALIPTLNVDGSGSRQRTPGDVNGTGAPRTSSTYAVVAEIPSYEVDFFGRVASLRDQARAQFFATEEAARSARLILISSVARQAYTVLALDEQVELAQQTLTAANETFELNQQSFDAGVASELDLRTAEAQRESVRATLAELEQQRDQAHNALTLLVGTPLPDDLPAATSLASATPVGDPPAGLPAELLTRRPDILAAEQTLIAANANIGIARAAFFPSIRLTANAGTASADLDGLFSSGSKTWAFTPSITVPIFAAGANRARLNIANVEKRIEIVNYQSAIQTAFREVADALAVRRSIGVQIDAQSARVKAAAKRLELSQSRFDAGVDPYLNVLLAQQEHFAAQQALIQARLTSASNLAALYAALGGGA